MAFRSFCEDVVNNVSVDFGNGEVQDIASAVKELLQRYSRKMDEQGPFKISRLHACGSMEEKTALWKSHPKYLLDKGQLDQNYIEFDYLAILEKPKGFVHRRGCPACIEITGVEIAKTAVDEQLADEKDIPGWLYNHPSVVEKEFHSRLISSLVSLCDCYTIEECIKSEKIDRRNEYKIIQTSGEVKENCTACTVCRQSGSLHIATLTPSNYGSALEPKGSSLVLRWTSTAKTLMKANSETLQRNKQIDDISINIDLLPAYELFEQTEAEEPEHKCFIVAKKCSLCVENGTWRVSYSINETDAFLNVVSTNHRKCYMVIKYLCEQTSVHNILASSLNGYHVKTAVLRHSEDCSVEDNDYTRCIFSIMGHLRSAFSCNHLDSYVDKVNLIRLRDTDADYLACEHILRILQTMVSEASNTQDCISILKKMGEHSGM